MLKTRSTVTLYRAPDYYSKNVFLEEQSGSKSCSNDLFCLEATQYLAQENLGAGAFGVVCRAIDSKLNKQVAIKKITRVFKNQSTAKCALREIRITRELSHENIINSTDVLMRESGSGQDIYIVMDLMETDLLSVLKSNQTLNEKHFQYFFYQILKGLKYLHSAGIIHRDLKPANLLLNEDCSLKIADFGMSRSGPSTKTTPNTSPNAHISGDLSQYVSTLWYRAPEILLSMGEYDTQVDIWSAGCILAEMLLLRPIFTGTDSYSQIQLLIEYLGTPDEQVIRRIKSPSIRDYISSFGPKTPLPFTAMFPNASIEARNIVSKMLQISPWKRFSAEQLLEEPFVKHWHTVKNEPSCPNHIRQNLLETAKYEGDVIIKGLQEEVRIFEKKQKVYPSEGSKVTHKNSLKQVFGKILFKNNKI
ncbi:Mitogen-activated protein kinase [Caenorhabditis elegans]|uniref:Mitogen-activated protein kinase n=1 Tax=Caenorhabditis elegans TaxID=6239 RepID=Q19243_CAEEL|nr:Mitogen-activated protein kinase [Caenorhabditis elegans]CCD63062.1 Mitogen-activated protein kinase [Caenorhabditis elegans]|eukprot:NP_872069.1 Mitogen-activated protein kinase [Caenorhabditis elegans]